MHWIPLNDPQYINIYMKIELYGTLIDFKSYLIFVLFFF